MKKRHFFHLGLLCLFLTVICNDSNATTFMIHSSEIPDNNGTEVSIQGLTATPIEVTFQEQAKGKLISITISTASGAILHQEKTEKEVLDYSALQLPKGEKTLLIEMGNESITIMFN